jgi:hypothetical protein
MTTPQRRASDHDPGERWVLTLLAVVVVAFLAWWLGAFLGWW